jgi:hypothetical protein
MRTAPISSLTFAVLATAAVVCTPPLVHGQNPPSPAPSGPTSTRPGMPGTPPPRDTSARGPAAAVGTGVVRGRIVAGDTGLPLRRARVMLITLGKGEPRVTLSDADGAFAFDGLPAGRYQLHGSKARYVDGTLGARRPGAVGRPFELADGQAFDSVVLTLAAAGVITGRVLDDFGDIVPGVAVMAMRYRTINGERQLVELGMGRPAASDDTGTFRLYGLAPGTYYVSARAEEMNRIGPAVTDATVTGFAPTFYPGTPVEADAQPIEVVAGAEVVADVTLVAARLTSVSGFVVDASGTRATGGFVMTMQGGRSHGMGFGGGGGMIKPDGTFTVSGLAPGEYVVQARPVFGANAMFEDATANRRDRLATGSVTVSGDPIAGLRLAVVDPIRVPVNAIFDDASEPRPARVFVSANTQNGPGGSSAAIRDDGRLTLEVVPGTYRLSVGSMGGGRWFVKQLTYRGREVEDGDEVDITAEPGGRIDVLFTSRSSGVDGSVTDDTGKPVADYTVVIFPEDADLLRRGSFNRVRVVRPDTEGQGRFRADYLRPGRYLAAAIPDAPIEDVYDPDFLDGLKRIAKPVRISEGASATVALTLTPLP